MLPRSWDRLTAVCLRFVFLVAALEYISAAHAQVFDLERGPVRIAELRGLWRFHPGDDQRWASPDFDDSNWPLLRSDLDWGAQGYPDLSGIAWYRFTIKTPPDAQDWAICLPELLTSYQVFVDGHLIGQLGRFPPDSEEVIAYDRTYSLPKTPPGQARPTSVAIRVWHSPRINTYRGGGPSAAPMVGNLSAISDWISKEEKGRYWSSSSGNVLMLMNLLACVGGFFLFAMRPGDREYLWFGIYEFLTGADHLCDDWTLFYPVSRTAILTVGIFVSAAS